MPARSTEKLRLNRNDRALLQRRWLKRRQAIEPMIGHLKADHRMNRCWLAGSLGDALHAVLCAAGYNLRWLLRAITRGRLKPLFFALWLAALNAMFIASALWSSSNKCSARAIARMRCESGRLPGVAAVA